MATQLQRDDAGHLIPHSIPPPLTPDDVPPVPKREPDWDLATDDPARDYVFRYAVATKRYGESLDCTEIEPSAQQGDRRRVEVRTKAGCAGSGTRDVFVVDAAGDRLSVDDKSKRSALARWPDGSDAQGPGNDVRQVDDLRKWQGPLGEEFRKLSLVPIRVQAYGRGTYPVVTIAGWHGGITPTASLEDLQGIAAEICKANAGLPMGIFANIDRSTMLRIRCPGSARWDRL
jgi:hypothetical protein